MLPVMKVWAKKALAPSARFVTRRCARVLMYHRFCTDGTPRKTDVRELDRQLTHLRRHFRVVRLRELIQRLQSGLDPLPYSVALTVDDVYADFGELAYPVFRRHGVPVTAYVVSEFAAGRTWLWADAIRYVVTTAKERRYAATRAPSADVRLSHAHRENAWLQQAELSLAQTPEERDAYLRKIQNSFSVELPSAPTREYAALDWAGLRALDPELVDLGAHTRTHPILARCDAKRIRDEIAGSRTDIERETGLRVRTFCYPNGTWSDVDARCFSAAREAGYEGAVMACGSLVCKGADIYALERIGVSDQWHMFLSDVSGISHLRRPLGAVALGEAAFEALPTEL